jgi:hypothetical protein
MTSALLTADSAKLSIEAIKPDGKVRVTYRDRTVDRSARRPLFFPSAQASEAARLRIVPFARLRGWDEEASRSRPSPSNTEYYLSRYDTYHTT